MMQRETIHIKGEPYKVGFSFLGIKIFEETAGKSITECRNTWDYLLYFYSVLKALNENFTMPIDEFTRVMDEHPGLLMQFQESGSMENKAAKPEKKNKEGGSLFTLWMLLPFAAVSPVLIPIISTVLWIWVSLKLLAKHIAKIGKKRASLPPHSGIK